MTQSIVRTHRKIPFSNFEAVRDAIRKLYPAEMIADYDGVFYRKGASHQMDFHANIYANTPLRDEMDKLGLLPAWRSTALIVSNKELGIHGDGDPSFMYTLVIPIWNTEDTYTEFFECSEGPHPTVLEHTDHIVHYDGYHIDKCNMIDSIEILEPTVINTDIPHRVVHKSQDGRVRITAAIRLHGREYVENTLRNLYNEPL